MILSFSCKNFEEELPVISYNNTDTMNMNLCAKFTVYPRKVLFTAFHHVLSRFTKKIHDKYEFRMIYYRSYQTYQWS